MVPSSVRFAAAVVAGVSGVLIFAGARHAGVDGEVKRGTVLVVAIILGAAGLLSGMLEQALRPLLVAVVIVVMTQRRIPVAWLAIGGVLFALLNPAKASFREQSDWGGFDKEQIEQTKGSVFANVQAITGPAKGYTPIVVEDYVRVKDRPAGQGTGGTDEDDEPPF